MFEVLKVITQSLDVPRYHKKSSEDLTTSLKGSRQKQKLGSFAYVSPFSPPHMLRVRMEKETTLIPIIKPTPIPHCHQIAI